MTTQQMIEEIQEKIADKTLSFGCVILRFNWRIKEKCVKLEAKSDWEFYLVTLYFQLSIYKSNNTHLKDLESIVVIWHPVSLSRVLSALSFVSAKTYLTQYEENYKTKVETEEWDKFYRKILKEDGSDAYLQDQSDETIQALHGLLVR